MALWNRLVSRIDPDLRRLLGLLPEHRRRIALAVVLTVCAGASSSLLSILLGQLTDLGFYRKEAWVVVAIPLALVAVAGVNGLCMFLSSYLLNQVSQGLMASMRRQLFEAVLRWPAEVRQKHGTGFVSAKFVNEANAAMGPAARSCVMLVRDLLQIVALVGVLVWYSWQLTIVTLLTAPLIAFILRFLSRSLRGVVDRSQTLVAEILGRVGESYQAERLVKNCNSYARENERFGRLNEEMRRVSLRRARFQMLANPLTQLVSMLGVACVVSYALLQAQRGGLTMGEFITFITAMLLLLPPLRQISSLNAAFTTMARAAHSLFELLDEPQEQETGSAVLEHARGEIVFEHVSLRYPGASADALHDLSLTVRPGESLAVVGASGSGKSTLLSLVPRFREPTEGRILVDGADAREYTRASLRAQMSLVSQEVVLFDGTVRENIAYGAPDVSDEKMAAAVEAADLTELVASLPQGLDTPVGEAGGRLSGGQRQRISIARALLRGSPILLLDEATSALDSASESRIRQALERLRAGRTSITVAHRLATIAGADRILVMEAGRVVESGTHEELLALQGRYARLWRLQSVQGAAARASH